MKEEPEFAVGDLIIAKYSDKRNFAKDLGLILEVYYAPELVYKVQWLDLPLPSYIVTEYHEYRLIQKG